MMRTKKSERLRVVLARLIELEERAKSEGADMLSYKIALAIAETSDEIARCEDEEAKHLARTRE